MPRGPTLDPRMFPGKTYAKRKESKRRSDAELLRLMGGGLFPLAEEEKDKSEAKGQTLAPPKRLQAPLALRLKGPTRAAIKLKPSDPPQPKPPLKGIGGRGKSRKPLTVRPMRPKTGASPSSDQKSPDLKKTKSAPKGLNLMNKPRR
jgi:hypothetical protein